VQFETETGASGLLHSSAAMPGQFLATTKITGTKGAAWLQGEEVWIDTGDGPVQVPPPEDLPLVAPVPPPGELLHTAYDMWHSMGIDLAPYTRLYSVMRERILGQDVADDPPAGTFEDGVANQAIVDAIRTSAASGCWQAVAAGNSGGASA
jgi:predicted dehydrogenase